MRTRLATAGLCVVGAIMFAAAAPAAAKELRVDDDHAQCPSAMFTSIQTAVLAANPGDKVLVCAGTYDEQVRIANKDKLKLEGRGEDNPTIQPTAYTPPNAIVHINNSDDVTVKGFTISGPFSEPICSPDRHMGVFVDNSEDAKITDNHITEIRNANPALYGCQDGIAIQVGRDFLGSVGSAKIDHNLIDLYQKGGIVVDGAGSEGDIDHNEVVGDPGPNGAGVITAQNGIQISRGAGGQADHNTVYDNIYTGGPDAATGILLFETDAPLRVDHNDVHHNDDGISLYDVQGARIDHNESMNQVKYDGLYADPDTANNLFEENKAFGNFEHDCHDDSNDGGTAGTANTWKHNKGATENRPGLCEGATP